MAATIETLADHIAKAHSVFDLSHVPLPEMQEGFADLVARLQAAEAEIKKLQGTS